MPQLVTFSDRETTLAILCGSAHTSLCLSGVNGIDKDIPLNTTLSTLYIHIESYIKIYWYLIIEKIFYVAFLIIYFSKYLDFLVQNKISK